MDAPTRKKRKLSSAIIPIPNPDKKFHETWKPKIVQGEEFLRHPMNIPHPYRAVLFGPPGTGKTTVAMNLIVRQMPPFERILIIHIDGKFTKEYNRLKNFTKVTTIPAPDWWSSELKTIVILDDLEYKRMNDRQKANLDRLFGYVSTHKNITVLSTAQDGFNIAPGPRRSADIWVLWKGKDTDSMYQIARKGGLNKKDLDALFHCHDFELQDSLWLDTTPFSPWPLRINGTDIVDDVRLEECRLQYELYAVNRKKQAKQKMESEPVNKRTKIASDETHAPSSDANEANQNIS